jgi:DNA (cytosine-5)-methyltransferase 1
LFAIEKDPSVAEVYRRNVGPHVTVADVCSTDAKRFPRVDVLFASPPCVRASVAAQSVEHRLDLEMARAVARFVTELRPAFFFLENVIPYRHFEALNVICEGLQNAGYVYDVHALCMADFGVPQTRRRLILRASRDTLLNPLPEPTEWGSWFDAVFDLNLPLTSFSPVQVRRLPPHLWNEDFMMIPDSKLTRRFIDEPSVTVTANLCYRQVARAYLGGDVYRLTLRALARLQTFPDSFDVRTQVEGAVIGNAVPPEFSRRIVEATLCTSRAGYCVK